MDRKARWFVGALLVLAGMPGVAAGQDLIPLQPGQRPTGAAAGQNPGGMNIVITPGAGVTPAQPGGMPQWQPPAQPAQPTQPQWQPPAPQWEPPPAAPNPPAAPAAPAVSNGRPGRSQQLQGMLRTSSRRGPTGGFVRSHTVRLNAGDTVTITMASTAFDTYLVVQPPRGHQELSNDDIAQGVLDSRLEFTAPASGRYTVLATSYEAGATGGYRVMVDVNQPAAPVQTPSQPTFNPNQPPFVPTMPTGRGAAGRSGNGRILGVFVGIDDYQSASDLQGCADDARRMAQAFAVTGAMAQTDMVVLTDHQATVSAVSGAIRQLGARATQQDVFVFFYSGHGGQVTEVRRGNEIDGQDETILLQDGTIRDDEMDALLDDINSDTTLFALDSCHSGGFARDLDSPRRIGMYSSEEGVLSDTAPRYGAGGFLSHWLRLGVEGQAASPGGAVRVGDLINYVARQFADHRAEMTTTGDNGFATDQRLVVTRGAGFADHLWSARPGNPAVATR